VVCFFFFIRIWVGCYILKPPPPGRGGQGLMAFDLSRRGGRLVASFPVENGDEILLMTDGGQLIRVPVGRIRIASRNTQGVIIFRTGEGEKVVSVERLAEAGGGDGEVDDAAEGEGELPPDEDAPGEGPSEDGPSEDGLGE
jgi:hypothetical protein